MGNVLSLPDDNITSFYHSSGYGAPLPPELPLVLRNPEWLEPTDKELNAAIFRLGKLLGLELPVGSYSFDTQNSDAPEFFADTERFIIAINLPLEWIKDISQYSQFSGNHKLVRLFQTHALMTVVAYFIRSRTGIDYLHRRNSTQNTEITEVAELGLDVPIKAYSAQLILQWQVASALALRSITTISDEDRTALLRITGNIAHDTIVKYLTNEANKSVIDGEAFGIRPVDMADAYKLGCLLPASLQKMLKFDSATLKAANL